MRKIYLLVFVIVCGRIFAQSYPVGHTSYNFIDSTRGGGTAITGGITFPAGASGREIGTQVYYPATSAGDNTPLAAGQFPVIVFGHGLGITYDAYATFFDSMARNGFIVLLPVTEGSASPSYLDFGQDLAFVAGQMLVMNTVPGSFFYANLSGREAIGGHSTGGGCTFLADAYANDSVLCYFSFAAQETSPSAIGAASGITRPNLLFSGTYDCIAPPATNQIPMYDSLQSGCKTQIFINGGYYCEFADYNANCSTTESGCYVAGGLTSAYQQQLVRMYLEPYLDYYMKGICPAWTKFENLIDTATLAEVNQLCNTIVPQNAMVNGSNLFCQGDTTSIYATPAGYVYTWSNGGTGDLIYATQQGYYVVSVSNGTCSLSSDSFYLKEIYAPLEPTSINGPDTVCSGISNIVLTVSGDTGVTFAWTLSSGWVLEYGTGLDSVTVLSGDSSGSVWVYSQNACGTSVPIMKSIFVIPSKLGNVNGITGTSTMCPGTEINYAITPVSGANNYVWSYPVDWSLQSTNDSTAITVITGLKSGYIIVAAENGCGQSLPDSLPVTVEDPPTTTGIEGPDSVCLTTNVAVLTFVANITGTFDSGTWTIPESWTVNSIGDSGVVVIADNNGVIYYTAENGCGTGNTASKTVAIGVSPQVQILQSDNILTATPAGVSYQWFLNGNPINGANSQNYTPVRNGSYSVGVASQDGCTGYSDSVLIIVNAIEDLRTGDFRLYPNPAEGYVNVSVPEPGRLEIDDMQGQVVKRRMLENLENRVWLNDLNPGIYIVNILSGNAASRQRLVVY